MPQDYNKDAYPEPPSRTPAENKQTAVPNPAVLISKIFYYTVDVPVTTVRGIVESLRGDKKNYYYHQKFRRVPELTQCQQGDFVCYYEADMQWRRDNKVDQEIVNVMQSRLKACQLREGFSNIQNCQKEMREFDEASKAFQSRYGDLGAFGSAQRCLMKQKERMMKERMMQEAQKE